MVRSSAVVAGVITVSVAVDPGAASTMSHERLGLKLMLVDPGDLVSDAIKDRLAQAFFASYPAARARFNPTAPDSVVVSFDPAYAGIAVTAGATIICSATWANRHPLDADACGTHEFMHVAQGYGHPEPSWAVEGLADYGRFKYGLFNAEEGWSLPPVTDAQSYTDGYRVTARFFVWLETRIRETILDELDDAIKGRSYSPDFWKAATGRTVDELWADYKTRPAI
jgi:hypothetical protein